MSNAFNKTLAILFLSSITLLLSACLQTPQDTSAPAATSASSSQGLAENATDTAITYQAHTKRASPPQDDGKPLMDAVPEKHLNAEYKRLAASGIEALEDQDYDEASSFFNRALKLRPDKSYLHLLNGLTYHLRAMEGAIGDFDLAVEGYRAAVRFDASNWLASYFMGLLYIERSEFGNATQVLADALMVRPDDEKALSAFVFAAYRAGRAELAAAAIARLDELGALDQPERLQNAAMVLAAVGAPNRAANFVKKLEHNRYLSDREMDHLRRRIGDWERIYQDPDRYLQTVQYNPPAGGGFGAPSSGGFGGAPSSGGGFGGAPSSGGFGAPATDSGFPGMGADDPNADKMVVVDIVIIRTEETLSTSRGVNLLNGLTLQWGSTSSTTAGLSYSDSRSGSVGDKSFSITRALNIPAITYSLNLANSNSVRNEILARPTLVAMSGKTSTFFSGTDLNASAVATGSQGGQSVLVNKEIGVKLSITPTFTEEGRVRMNVVAERTFLNSPDSNVNYTYIIETSKTQVNANVAMRFGETLILSGLSEKEDANSRDGVPLLQDIPGLQYLFSSRSTENFQKSVLILVTPRPAQYIYQPENARREYEESLSEDERPLANLRSRYADWFKPYPNWASVFNHMQGNTLYRDFRTGDVELEEWSDTRLLRDRMRQVLDFLYF